jgi:hypothetical protein
MEIETEKPPTHLTKRFYKENKKVVFLVGYCKDSLGCYAGLFEEAKKDFPDLKPSDVICAKITQSSWEKGFTIIVFDATAEQIPDKTWEYANRIDFSY